MMTDHMDGTALMSLNTGYETLHAVVIVTFAGLACVAVALRLAARRIQHLALQLSDYVMVLGLVCSGNDYFPGGFVTRTDFCVERIRNRNLW